MEATSNVPSLLAILVCEHIVLEQGTGNKTLVGVFEDLWSLSEPIVMSIGFYAKMTDLEGIYRFSIRVVRISVESEIVVSGGDIQMEQPVTDRLANLDITLNLQTVFPNFGKYEFQLFANDMYIGRAVVNCREREAPSQ